MVNVKGPCVFRRKSTRHRSIKKQNDQAFSPLSIGEGEESSEPPYSNAGKDCVGDVGTKTKKNGNTRLWMRFNQSGISELVEFDKSVIIQRASIPARDLRILGPVFSQSSHIIAREKALVVNLEYIKAIITAEEVLLLDPLCQEVLPFVDQLGQQLRHKSQSLPSFNLDELDNQKEMSTGGNPCVPIVKLANGLQGELPFEFQVLEIALGFLCSHLDSSVTDLERGAYPELDELARNVNNKNLEHVRSLKSNLTRLLGRVQQVRDEIEHLLDDNEHMAQLYLTRKQTLHQQFESLLGSMNSNCVTSVRLPRSASCKNGNLVISNFADDHNVEDLEMLLEAYFMQLDRTRDKILSVKEYIDDTEDYVNLQLDHQRNEMIELQLILNIVSFAVAIGAFISGAFGMNMPCEYYDKSGIFWNFVGEIIAGCILIFYIIYGYAKWNQLL